MRKLSIILATAVILVFSTSVYAEEYKCSYLYNQKEFSLTLEKVTDYSYNLNMDYETEEYILGETDKLLILGAPQIVDDGDVVFRLIFMDKIDKTFTLTSVIEPSLTENYEAGIWGYAKGTCD